VIGRLHNPPKEAMCDDGCAVGEAEGGAPNTLDVGDYGCALLACSLERFFIRYDGTKLIRLLGKVKIERWEFVKRIR
jgi:hypothetical protein